MIRSLIAAGALALVLVTASACTLTNSAGETVVVTKENILQLVVDKIMASCKFYNANSTSLDLVKVAALAALDASDKVKSGATRLQSLADIACPLLAPPPTADGK